MTDLIRRFHAGEPSAFAELVSDQQDDLYTLCARCIGPADAEALSESILLKAHQAMHRLDADTNLHTWLLRLGVEHIEAHIEGVDQGDAGLHDRSATVHRLLQALEMPFRIAVVMRDVLGMPEEKIADILQLSLGTTRSRIHRARLTMARGLAPKMDGV